MRDARGARPPPSRGYDYPPRRPDMHLHYDHYHCGPRYVYRDPRMPVRRCPCCGVIGGDEDILFVLTARWGIVCGRCVCTGRLSHMVDCEVRDYDLLPMRRRVM